MITEQPIQAQRWQLTGQVQGVGFRPYVYRLAVKHQLQGWVKNLAGNVEIHVQGQPQHLQQFAESLIRLAPPLAHPQIESCQIVPCEVCTQFTILPSEVETRPHIHIPTDYFTCSECLAELRNPHDRRYQYPFINCTQCGPRYTLIERLPYDRPNTSMAHFPLCADCALEYHNPADRRFHAQPLACPVCGPQVWWENNTGSERVTEPQQALQRCLQALKCGEIVGVKGVGGYHLLCDASHHASIQRLRLHKPRPAKPLAVLFPELGADGLEQIKQYVQVSADAAALLRSPQRPIVLLPRQQGCTLSPLLAPGLKEIGVMLPYSPLHHLLLDRFAAPLVATSANISGEPVLTQQSQVQQRLAHVADSFLHHTRPIVRPADDSVFRYIAHKPRPIRLARGYAPQELPLNQPLVEPVLAVGGHLKNTIALAWEDRLVVSPHIGELAAPLSLDTFAQTINDLQRLYRVKVKSVIHDAHPNYASTRWAKAQGLPCHSVLHHHAHAAALAGEYQHQAPDNWLIFVWDGVGYGADHSLWGGEVFHGQLGAWQRVGHWRPFFLPGGEKAGRAPWRSAAALCWEVGLQWPIPVKHDELIYQAWQRRLNCPRSTAAGRLFDAAAALLGLVHHASYEAQGPMLLEAMINQAHPGPVLPLQALAAGQWQLDWEPLLSFLLNSQYSIAERASGFHHSLAQGLCAQAQQLAQHYPVTQVGLCGGVFQNQYLTELSLELLNAAGFNSFLPQQFPCNDAAISVGQVMEFSGHGLRK